MGEKEEIEISHFLNTTNIYIPLTSFPSHPEVSLLVVRSPLPFTPREMLNFLRSPLEGNLFRYTLTITSNISLGRDNAKAVVDLCADHHLSTSFLLSQKIYAIIAAL